MACKQCQKDARMFYKALAKENGKTYLVYTVDKNEKIIEENDFKTAIQIGQIPANTESAVLE